MGSLPDTILGPFAIGQWHHRRRRQTEDSVAFASLRLLRGDAVGLFNELGQGVPAWAWVNMLAHSRPGELASIKRPHRFGWEVVVAHLATELLNAGQGCPEVVGLVQRAALVPLELALLGGEVTEPVTPGQLGVLVMTALYQAQIQTHIRDNRHEA